MNLDKLTVNIKPLTAYQAIDLGMAVARAYYTDLFRLWWRGFYRYGLTVFVCLVVYLMSLVDNGILVGLMCGLFSYLVIFPILEGKFKSVIKDNILPFIITLPMAWVLVFFFGTGFEDSQNTAWAFWLSCVIFKASFERSLLIFLSRKLFDKDFGIDDIKDDFAPFGSRYVLGRISFQRMMSMPVYLLENQSGKHLKSRLSTLTRNQAGAIHLHGLFFVVAELVFAFASVFVVDILIGVRLAGGLSSELNDMLMAVMYLFGIALLSPFYVASGFVMYLCKRSLLEGWDIELVFRKLARRHEMSFGVQHQNQKAVSDD